MEEPQTEFEEAAAGITVDYTTGRTDSVLPQRAPSLPKDSAPDLVEVPGISAVDFDSNKRWNIIDHLISVDGVMTILKSCPYLEEACISVDYLFDRIIWNPYMIAEEVCQYLA